MKYLQAELSLNQPGSFAASNVTDPVHISPSAKLGLSPGISRFCIPVLHNGSI